MKKADKILKLVVLAVLLIVAFGPLLAPIALLDEPINVKEVS